MDRVVPYQCKNCSSSNSERASQAIVPAGPTRGKTTLRSRVVDIRKNFGVRNFFLQVGAEHPRACLNGVSRNQTIPSGSQGVRFDFHAFSMYIYNCNFIINYFVYAFFNRQFNINQKMFWRSRQRWCQRKWDQVPNWIWPPKVTLVRAKGSQRTVSTNAVV